MPVTDMHDIIDSRGRPGSTIIKGSPSSSLLLSSIIVDPPWQTLGETAFGSRYSFPPFLCNPYSQPVPRPALERYRLLPLARLEHIHHRRS
jgi:hypothetical protein